MTDTEKRELNDLIIDFKSSKVRGHPEISIPIIIWCDDVNIPLTIEFLEKLQEISNTQCDRKCHKRLVWKAK